jgi:hypothetical protein
LILLYLNPIEPSNPQTKFIIFFQVSLDTLNLQIGSVSVLCILVSISAGCILCSYYRSVPHIKKNILTRLDELYVMNFTFFVCAQCLVCLFSLLCEARNEYLYLVFFIIIYGSFDLCGGIGIALSFCRVFIIFAVSK